MVDLDMERARNLLKSAKDLHKQGDLAGVAGLAYAAFESATMTLTSKLNGKDYRSHNMRRERAKTLLKKYQDKIDVLWEIRNVDFYGNVKIGTPKREISQEEIEECLDVVEKVIKDIEKILKEN
ncbi:HEPN domain-containing protein [Methanobacterium sp.]|uniref:HEPN domain-containing protein n=1 Tax=Methanobacterium sp. TaxID=2164 RepID=UPI0031592EE0